MKLTGLHLLLTYKCNYECDHCFVWSGPSQPGVMTLAQIHDILDQASELGTIEWIYLEGGEPFLYHPVLVEAATQAHRRGFHVGVVTNNYWATAVPDALQWLRPLAGIVDDLSISTDLFHADEVISQQARCALEAAGQLRIPTATIVCELPESESQVPQRPRGAPVEGGTIAFRGRAAATLAPRAKRLPWRSFDACPHEQLDAPSRVHVDPLGHLHLCQGLTMGNLFDRRLTEIVETYDPNRHPIVAPLVAGGPAALTTVHELPCAEGYADACHLCYEARSALRERYPQHLAPDQVYGDTGDDRDRE